MNLYSSIIISEHNPMSANTSFRFKIPSAYSIQSSIAVERISRLVMLGYMSLVLMSYNKPRAYITGIFRYHLMVR